ncbi:MAG: type II toxin-antitoxin system PemK/MazF family toxin [Cytophagales bacterium]|nr:type II toxin-antitoxin system PemK/MazF family toxin [Cytophagales bacterium]
MKKGEIWLIEIPPVNGREQRGTRPALILSVLEANIVIILPFTSNLQALRFPHTIEIKLSNKNGLNSNSIALVFQIRAIDKKRLKNKIGTLETKIIQRINTMIIDILNLKIKPKQ